MLVPSTLTGRTSSRMAKKSRTAIDTVSRISHPAPVPAGLRRTGAGAAGSVSVDAGPSDPSSGGVVNARTSRTGTEPPRHQEHGEHQETPLYSLGVLGVLGVLVVQPMPSRR